MSNLPPLPPPIPPIPSSRRNLFVQLARVSWLSILLSMAVNFSLTFSLPATWPQRSMVTGIIGLVFMIGGIVCGIIALCGVSRYGRKGILAPALTGLGIWVLLIALAVPVALMTKRMAANLAPTHLAPVVHTTGAAKLEDPALGVSLDVPEGYESRPDLAKAQGYRYAYIHRAADGSVRVFMVKALPTALPRHHHLTPAELPAGSGAVLTSFQWRGLTIDGTRVPESSPTGPFVTFNVLVPLKKQGVTIGFGGPQSDEAEMRALTEQTLASLEGETNW